MDYETYNATVRQLLHEINDSKGLDLELVPGWSHPVMDQVKSISYGYKIHCKTGKTKTMSLNIHAQSFVQSRDGSTTLRSTTTSKIIAELTDFWSDGNSERHRVVDV